jgi:hypothetical protein
MYKVEFIKKNEGTRQHGRHARIWEDNIKIDLKEIR